jgi:hypothetical protein
MSIDRVADRVARGKVVVTQGRKNPEVAAANAIIDRVQRAHPKVKQGKPNSWWLERFERCLRDFHRSGIVRWPGKASAFFVMSWPASVDFDSCVKFFNEVMEDARVDLQETIERSKND